MIVIGNQRNLDSHLREDTIRKIRDIKRQMRLFICYTSRYYTEKVLDEITFLEKLFKMEVLAYAIRTNVTFIPLQFPTVQTRDIPIQSPETTTFMNIKSMLSSAFSGVILHQNAEHIRNAYCEDFSRQASAYHDLVTITISRHLVPNYEQIMYSRSFDTLLQKLVTLQRDVCSNAHDNISPDKDSTFGQYLRKIKSKFDELKSKWNKEADAAFRAVRDVNFICIIISIQVIEFLICIFGNAIL